MSKFSKILDRLRNDFHVPVAMAVFITVTVYHFKTGKDLGSNYVNSIYAMYAFLAGHAIAGMKYGDSPSQDAEPAQETKND